MAKNVNEAVIRLYSRHLYIYRDKIGDLVMAATDLQTFSHRTGIPYQRLRYWFKRRKHKYYETDGFQVFRLDTAMIFNRNS